MTKKHSVMVCALLFVTACPGTTPTMPEVHTMDENSTSTTGGSQPLESTGSDEDTGSTSGGTADETGEAESPPVGVCAGKCRDNDDCVGGSVCDDQFCAPPAQCGEACGNGTTCVEIDGLFSCVVPCDADEQCGDEGSSCSLEISGSLYCSFCIDDDDCTIEGVDKGICYQGRCMCSVDGECGDGQVCIGVRGTG